MLFGGGEKGKELMGGGTEVADASGGGQRADMEQNSGGTLKLHIFIIGWKGQSNTRRRRDGYNPPFGR
jgi:hypothetical protein